MNALELMDSNLPFAAWHVPGADHITVMKGCEVSPLSGLDHAEGFVLAPFHPSAAQGALLWKGTPEALPLMNEPSRKADVTPTVPTEAYRHAFETFSKALQAGRFQKLVLSREKPFSTPFHPSEAFLRACRSYPDSFTYLCRSPQSGLWMGSTPEILLKGEGNQWQTVALAGTQPWSDHCMWDHKNRHEQALVAQYIRAQLCGLGITPTESEPQTVRAGALAHLKTTFRFASDVPLSQIVNALHPTPAVCGLPRDEAIRFILENEGHHRSYYSGYVGTLAPGAAALYVNLRCLHNHTLYAGGGLLPESTLESEWTETERKMCTMLNIMSNELLV